ncbi:MAG: UbiA family prenyltransferase [Desulfurococcales archaeon]|nr:UbiA family prenyltransferase [Desulfurococcales archaeon]
MGRLKTLFLVTRPWSFPFTVLVVTISGLLPLLSGEKVSWLLLALAAAGSVLLHAMVNVLNDYFDWKLGLDRPGVGTVEYRPHPVVHKILTPQGTFLFGLGSGLAGLALAAITVYMGRPLAVLLGALGLLLAYAYSGWPFDMKYHGLGELGVYLAWGVLIPVGSYYMASGKISLVPVLVLLPLGVGITGILMANNIRDIESDRSAGIKTLQVRLGFRRSVQLFKATIYSMYILGFVSAAVNKYLVIPALLALATLPEARRVARMFDSGQAPPDADPRVAMLLQKYAMLYMVGVIISILLVRL